MSKKIKNYTRSEWNVLALKEWTDLSYGEIAAITGLTPQKVTSMIRTASYDDSMAAGKTLYNNYILTRGGDIYSLTSGKWLEPYRNGNVKLTISQKGKKTRKHFTTHSLMEKYFK